MIGTHTKDDAGMRNNKFYKPMAPWVGNENSDESGVGDMKEIESLTFIIYVTQNTCLQQFVEDA